MGRHNDSNTWGRRVLGRQWFNMAWAKHDLVLKTHRDALRATNLDNFKVTWEEMKHAGH